MQGVCFLYSRMGIALGWKSPKSWRQHLYKQNNQKSNDQFHKSNSPQQQIIGVKQDLGLEQNINTNNMHTYLGIVFVYFGIYSISIHSVSSNLTSESVSEGECIKPVAYAHTNFTWVIQPRVFYIPMASEHYYRNYAETFLGRHVESEEELNNMRLRIDVVYSRIANMGYDRHFILMCLPMGGLGKLNCTYVSGSNPTTPNSLETTIDTIVWTDNKTAALFVRCINGSRRNWKLAQTVPTLDPEIQNKTIEIIESLGFHTNLISYRI